MAAARNSATAVDIAGMQRPTGTLDLETALEPFHGPLGERLAAHLLRRAGFGGTPDEIGRYAAMPVDDAVKSLIRFPSTASLPEPGELADPTALRRQLRAQDAASYAALSDMQKREINREVNRAERESVVMLQRWWLDRMLQTPAPLQEKMTFYFHGHFTTAAVQKGVSPAMIYGQNQLFRDNALGNLRTLTLAVAQDPAMLLYLDNADSSKAHPNENFARESMELFTLGVDHYTEQDVREAARAWTGYVVDRRDGQAYFLPRRHDDGVKTFLDNTGNFGAREIVAIIFAQKQCARFFANSLLNLFVYNDPEPQLVDAVTELLWSNDYELTPVMSAILRSNVFYGARAYRALVKSPVEFVVGTYKALAIPQTEPNALRALTAMGQRLFYPPNVAGWPGGDNWLTSQMLIARENFVAQLIDSQVDRSQLISTLPDDAHAATTAMIATLLQGDASPSSYAQLTGYLNGDDTSALGMLSGENRDERLRGAAYLTMAMPAYQLN